MIQQHFTWKNLRRDVTLLLLECAADATHAK